MCGKGIEVGVALIKQTAIVDSFGFSYFFATTGFVVLLSSFKNIFLGGDSCAFKISNKQKWSAGRWGCTGVCWRRLA